MQSEFTSFTLVMYSTAIRPFHNSIAKYNEQESTVKKLGYSLLVGLSFVFSLILTSIATIFTIPALFCDVVDLYFNSKATKELSLFNQIHPQKPAKQQSSKQNESSSHQQSINRSQPINPQKPKRSSVMSNGL